MSCIRLAVVSDVHAQVGRSEDSYISVQPPDVPRNEHPFADLLTYVSEFQLDADFVLCPGDLSNRADDSAKIYGWEQLHRLADALGARAVYAAPGNHDLTTMTPVPDRAATLKNLSPSYPTGRPAADEAFWTEGFSIIDEHPYRLLVLNSCHGYPPHPGDGAECAELVEYFKELDRGSFPQELQTKLEDALGGLAYRPVNVALLHHHPVEHERRSVLKDSYGPMRRGDEFLRILDEHPKSGRWFVLHGHKHVPRLVPASGDSANSPVVMGAASLGAQLWHPVVTVARNQFHIIEFETSMVPGIASLRGTIESYMWGYGVGWSVSGRRNSGLPPLCGFGPILDHRVLAASVDAQLRARAVEFASWHLLEEVIPELRYQSPRDFEMFEAELSSLGLAILRDDQERVLQIARKVS
jgi:metallophosphoesterase superfamily enzyme